MTPKLQQCMSTCPQSTIHLPVMLLLQCWWCQSGLVCPLAYSSLAHFYCAICFMQQACWCCRCCPPKCLTTNIFPKVISEAYNLRAFASHLAHWQKCNDQKERPPPPPANCHKPSVSRPTALFHHLPIQATQAQHVLAWKDQQISG